MITVVGGTKGGSGKSTVATNFAVMLAASGRDVLLVDADEQQTSASFTLLRNEARPGGAGYTCISLKGRAVVTEVRRLSPKYQDILIDTGGHDAASQRAALTVCDAYVVPFAPRSFDIWTVDKVADLVEEARALNPEFRAVSFLNRADPRGPDNAAAADILGQREGIEFIPETLGNRKSYAYAASEGLAVTELRPRDRKAEEEIRALFAAVFGTRAPD